MQESKTFSGEREMNAETAELEINAIRQEIYMRGANDVEFNEIADILKALKNGTRSPGQAVADAQKICDSKMDYH